MNFIIYITIVTLLCSCNKSIENNKSETRSNQDIPAFLASMAKNYSGEINATSDRINDTLIFRLQGPPAIICPLDDFKKKYIDLIAQGICKNVYLGFTGDYSVEWLHMPNGRLVSPANLGNLYFYIYSDFYQLERDSFYSIINIRVLYNLTEPPFK
ncbi:hypothetical protein [Niastella sp. OAS944]|uniref:hypothetical protein n=1 Tax=Niastella sp. OAS944 TaxID=2664089 RepID=UPI00347A7687|nr:hypothetical protein [Chitinophagaceae bacterium OAS944]